MMSTFGGDLVVRWRLRKWGNTAHLSDGDVACCAGRGEAPMCGVRGVKSEVDSSSGRGMVPPCQKECGAATAWHRRVPHGGDFFGVVS